MMADELESPRTSAIARVVPRHGLVIVIASFGVMKFTYYQTHGASG